MADKITIPDAVQGARHVVVTLTWPDNLDLTGATLSGTKREVKSTSVTAIDGTLTPDADQGANPGVFTWARGAGDVGTAGVFQVQLKATFTDFEATIESPWVVHALQSATAVAAEAIVGVSASEGAWLTAEKAATEAATDGEILQSDGDNSEGSGYQTATSLRKHNFTGTAAPGVGDDADDGYAAGSVWVDTVGGAAYVCVDPSAGAAVWVDITAGAGAINWGSIGGTLSNQTDVQSALDGKETAGAAATVQGNLDDHGADTGNPHNVTAAQAGAVDSTGDSMTGDLDMGGNEIQNYGEEVTALGDTGGGSVAINVSNGSHQTLTISTSTTTISFTGWPTTGTLGSVTLEITNGGSQTVNWTNVIWAGGSAPSLTSSGVDVITLYSHDAGTTVYGFAAGLDMS